MVSRPENDPTFDNCPEPSALQESVWALLEDAGAPNDLLEKVDKLIDVWERAQQQASDEDATYRLWNKER